MGVRTARVGEVVCDQDAGAVGEAARALLLLAAGVDVVEGVGLRGVGADAALLDPQDVLERHARERRVHHRVEARVGAVVGEDDKRSADAGERGLEHVREEVLEGGGEVRASAAHVVVLLLLVRPAVRRVERELEVLVLVDVDEEELLQRRS